MYVCMKCGKEFKEIPEGVTCTYCGYKIIMKKRPPIARKVKAE